MSVALEEIASRTLAVISHEELEQLLKAAAKAGIAEHEREKEKEKKKDKYKCTFALLKSYRSAAYHTQNAKDENIETALILERIDKAAEKIRCSREAAGRAAEYEAFSLYFFDGLEYEKIADKLNTGKNTPRRWVTGIVQDMAILLYGLEE